MSSYWAAYPLCPPGSCVPVLWSEENENCLKNDAKYENGNLT